MHLKVHEEILPAYSFDLHREHDRVPVLLGVSKVYKLRHFHCRLYLLKYSVYYDFVIYHVNDHEHFHVLQLL